MWSINQIISQVRQLLLFHKVFPLKRILKDVFSFPKEYHGRLGKAGYPWAINLLVTSKCNLDCGMCSFDNVSKMYANEEELSFNAIKDFVGREYKNKPHIFLSGGEPFMRRDILEIIKIIKRMGLTCGICTNGILLDEIKIKELIKLKVEYMIFSLLGPKEVHDAITGVPGAFNKLYDNIRLLSSLNNGMKIILSCAVTKSNLGHLSQTAEIAEKLNVNVLRFEHLNFLTNSEIEEHIRLFKKEFPEERMFLSSYCASSQIYDSVFYDSIIKMEGLKSRFRIPIYFKPVLNKLELRSWYSDNFNVNRRCAFIWKSLFISPNGDFIPCQFFIYKLGNIKTDSLEEIWNSRRYRELRLRLKKGLLPGCSRCCKL